MKRIKHVGSFLFISIFLFFIIEVTGWCRDDVSKKNPYRVPSVSSQVKVDGILDEKVWQEALVLQLDYEVEPGENMKPPVKTDILLAYGSKHLYVAFRAYDPDVAEIRAHVTDRDNITNDDYVGIVLDTFNESRCAYRFLCNPYGIQADEVVSLIGGGNEWDAIWNSAGKITKKGYSVEMAIPFTSLRFQGKKDDQVWGIDALRSYPRSLSHLIGLFPRDRSNNCYMCQADKVIGFKGAKAGLNLELDPTISAILTRERGSFPDGEYENVKKELDPGISARWSITPNLTLSGAVNPDFSQVEADAAQLDINTQFALYYPEKRPLFLEGAGIFRSRLVAIYTRTVIDPDWGVKITGKEGDHAVGFFFAKDTVTNFIFPTSQSSQTASLDMNNFSTAFRYRWDVGKSSNLGVIMTDREGDDYYNRLAAVDGDIRFTKKDRFMFQYLGSRTRYPDHIVTDYNQPAEKFTGSAFDLYYTHNTQHVFIYGQYQDIGADYRADVGFADQADNILLNGGGQYTWRRNPGHWFTQIALGSGYSHETDHNKNLLRKSVQGWLNYWGPLQSGANLNVNIGKRTFMGNEFNDNTLFFSVWLRPSGSFFLGLRGWYGDRVDFTNVQAGTGLRLNPAIQSNMGPHFYIGLDHVFEKLNVDAGELYTANLTNLSLVYQFNRRAFLRTILQYADYRYNSQLYLQPRDPEFKHLFSQVLFSYKINPQTVLFLGYSDDYYGFSQVPVTRNNYTFFLKIGYALVL